MRYHMFFFNDKEILGCPNVEDPTVLSFVMTDITVLDTPVKFH